MEEKKLIRKKALGLRSTLTIEEVKEKSSIIVGKLINMIEFQKGKFIMCYLDYKNEVETEELVKQCLILRKRVAVPVIVDSPDGGMDILASEIFNIDSGLRLNCYGIREPEKDIVRVVEPYEFDIVIVPGVAFDTQKYRMGYGAGFYDRFLKKLKSDCIKIGIAFELQIFDRIPVEKHDVPMDFVITENNIFI